MGDENEASGRLKPLESSLVNFLSMKRDIDEKIPGGRRRLVSLTLGLNLVKGGNPLFTVQIGLCEAAFNMETGLKERGSCYGLERYIRDWYDRPTVSGEMKKIASTFVQIKKSYVESSGGSSAAFGKKRKYKLDDSDIDFLDEFFNN